MTNQAWRNYTDYKDPRMRVEGSARRLTVTVSVLRKPLAAPVPYVME